MRRLLAAAARLDGRGQIAGVVVAVPAVATRRDVRTFASTLTAAVRAPIRSMQPALSASLATELWGARQRADVYGPRVVLDVGAGVVQIEVAWQGRLRAQAGAALPLPADLEQPAQFSGCVSGLLSQVLAQTPESLIPPLMARPIRLVGGGALVPGLADTVAAACDLDVEVAADAGSSVVEGLSRLTAASRRPT